MSQAAHPGLSGGHSRRPVACQSGQWSILQLCCRSEHAAIPGSARRRRWEGRAGRQRVTRLFGDVAGTKCASRSAARNSSWRSAARRPSSSSAAARGRRRCSRGFRGAGRPPRSSTLREEDLSVAARRRLESESSISGRSRTARTAWLPRGRWSQCIERGSRRSSCRSSTTPLGQ